METTGQIEAHKKYNLNNIPQTDSPDLGGFVNRLWKNTKREKIIRLNLHSRWVELHKKFRGKKNRGKKYPLVGANYLFKTVQGFCAMLTEKYPRAEVQTDEGADPQQVKALDADTAKWWHEEEMQKLLYASVQNFQVYGTTVEKFVFDKEINTTKIILRDPFNFFPSPGFKMCNMRLPYCIDAYFLDTWDIKDKFDIPHDTHISPDADEQLFGRDRETTRGGLAKKGLSTSGNLPSNYADVEGSKGSGLENKALVLELWIIDKSVDRTPVYEEVQATYEGTDEPVYDDLGRPVLTTAKTRDRERPRYPGKIRKITFCPTLLKSYNNGILDDRRNPNVNWNLIDVRMQVLLAEGKPEFVVDDMGNIMVDEATGEPAIENVPVDEDTAYALAHASLENTFLYSNFPFSAVSSLIDTSQWWGFSIIEQLEELVGKAEALLTKYLAYFDMAMFPIFVNPKGSGVKNSQITNAPGVVINPTIEAAVAMRYVPPPSPPVGILDLIQFLLFQVDVVSGTPEVTEGRKPKGVSAASAIIALQDKASTLFQPQIWAVDRIVNHRGNAHVSFVQNFGTEEKPIKVDDEFVKFLGVDLWGSFKYMVESGSSAPITKSGRRTQYIELFRIGAMSLKPLLEMLEVPNKVIEEVIEQFSVPGALKLLIDAGLPEEVAQDVYKIILENPGIGGDQGGGPAGEGTQTQVQPTGANAGASDRAKQAYGQMRLQ